MEIYTLLTFLTMGLLLGMLHAFDPDHLAAVSGMNATVSPDNVQPSQRPFWRFTLHWALGHGGALLLIAASVLVVGQAIPEELSAIAENSVPYILMAIGLMALARLFFFSRNTASGDSGAPCVFGLQAPFVGLIHGIAGSAPLLALIPLANLSHPMVGMLYVFLFSLGVVIAMLCLASVFSRFVVHVRRFDAFWQLLLQASLAGFSLIVGIYLLFT